jgi:phosphate starvation-inducible PhoH-like protein
MTKTTSRKKNFISQEPQLPLLQHSDFKRIKFTKKQLEFFNSIKENTIITCTGPAGTAKTFVACYSALDHYARGVCKKIILVKPAVESGDALGFLPGSLQEKIAPFMDSYVSNMEKIIGKENLSRLVDKGIIEMKSLSHIRGSTEDESFMIMDETQNSDLRQMMLFVTRMGSDSKIVMCGDTTQWDMAKRKRDFSIFSGILEGIKSVEKFRFEREDIVRNPILIEITDRYEKYKAENNLD